jgi:hypothetical protein
MLQFRNNFRELVCKLLVKLFPFVNHFFTFYYPGMGRVKIALCLHDLYNFSGSRLLLKNTCFATQGCMFFVPALS